jgi:hypothetical protein
MECAELLVLLRYGQRRKVVPISKGLEIAAEQEKVDGFVVDRLVFCDRGVYLREGAVAAALNGDLYRQRGI